MQGKGEISNERDLLFFLLDGFCSEYGGPEAAEVVWCEAYGGAGWESRGRIDNESFGCVAILFDEVFCVTGLDSYVLVEALFEASDETCEH